MTRPSRKSLNQQLQYLLSQIQEQSEEIKRLMSLISVPRIRAMNGHVVNYWMKYYVNRLHCSLCGNRGVIDTRGATTPAGVEVGRRNWCICPNGQAIRKAVGERLPEQNGP